MFVTVINTEIRKRVLEHQKQKIKEKKIAFLNIDINSDEVKKENALKE